MKVIDIINSAAESKKTLFTFELLPPLKGDGVDGTFSVIDSLMEFSPAYINVTYHREDTKYVDKGGGLLERRVVRRRPGTVGISGAIMKRYGVEVVPHLICGGLSRYDIEDSLIDLDFLGINNVLALRGDNLRGENSFCPNKDGHSYAVDLVRQIGDMNRGVFIDGEVDPCHNSSFCVGVAGYPEKHSEAPNIDNDIQFLKRKVDAGADYIVTQMSFDSGKILSFIDRCRKAGINVPIIPGIKPLSTLKQLTLLPQIFHVDIPEDLVKAVKSCQNSAQIYQVGVEWAIAQGEELKKAGVPVIHFYTMGKSDNMVQIAKKIF